MKTYMEKTEFEVHIQRWDLDDNDNLRKIDDNYGGADNDFIDILVLVDI